MTAKLNTRGRGRPRAFDPDQAVITAQGLFQRRGYDAVSVAELSQAMGVNPPSFYAAFGSKAGLFDRVLQRYASCDGLPVDAALRPGRAVDEALGELLAEAAGRYAADPGALGCLVIESARVGDPAACASVARLSVDLPDRIRAFVAARHPRLADALADYVVTTLAGLSAQARAGVTTPRLRAVAAVATQGISAAIQADQPRLT